MSPVLPGSLVAIMAKQDLPPAEAPSPILADEGVIEPPLPPVRLPTMSTGSGSSSTAPGPNAPNGQPTLVATNLLCGIAILVGALVLC